MKIAAIANCNALAHVSRLLEIASVLRDRGHEVLFGGFGEYLQVAAAQGFQTRELPYITRQQLVESVRSQQNLRLLYQYEQIKTFVDAELQLYSEFQPDLVMIDNRPTARISADKAGLKTVAVLNVQMSNYRDIPFYSLRAKFKSKWMQALATPLDRIENAIECQFYNRLVVSDLNRLRKDMGLEPLYSYQHEEGDLSFLADIPQFNPVHKMPAHAQFVGPLTWHNGLPAPECIEHLEQDRKTVYFSLGSDSLEELAEHLGRLTERGMQVVVACGKTERDIDSLKIPHVHFEEYVNTDELLPHCDVVCCHGGNGTLYQALSYGLPTIAVTTHAEQYYGARRIQQLHLGRVLTLEQLNREGMGVLVETVYEVLSDPSYTNTTQAFSQKLRGWSGAQTAATEIEHYGAS